MTERTLFLVRLEAQDIPNSGNVQKLDLPDPLTQMLDSDGWRVVSHELAIPGFEGGMVLSLYCERETSERGRVLS